MKDFPMTSLKRGTLNSRLQNTSSEKVRYTVDPTYNPCYDVSSLHRPNMWSRSSMKEPAVVMLNHELSPRRSLDGILLAYPIQRHPWIYPEGPSMSSSCHCAKKVSCRAIHHSRSMVICRMGNHIVEPFLPTPRKFKFLVVDIDYFH